MFHTHLPPLVEVSSEVRCVLGSAVFLNYLVAVSPGTYSRCGNRISPLPILGHCPPRRALGLTGQPKTRTSRQNPTRALQHAATINLKRARELQILSPPSRIPAIRWAEVSDLLVCSLRMMHIPDIRKERQWDSPIHWDLPYLKKFLSTHIRATHIQKHKASNRARYRNLIISNNNIRFGGREDQFWVPRRADKLSLHASQNECGLLAKTFAKSSIRGPTQRLESIGIRQPIFSSCSLPPKYATTSVTVRIQNSVK